MTNSPSGIKKLVAKTVDLEIGSVVKKLNSIAKSIESKLNNSSERNKNSNRNNKSNRNKVKNRLSKYLLPPHKGDLSISSADYNHWSTNGRGGSRKLKNMRKNKTRKNHRKNT